MIDTRMRDREKTIEAEDIIITHRDADGVGALVNLMRLGDLENPRVLYVNPEDLGRIINFIRRKLSGRIKRIFIMDLAPNKDSIEYIVQEINILKRSNIKIFWMDHHVWDSAWFDLLRRSGVEVYHDPNTCATGVVRAFFNSQDLFTIDLERVICSIDLWKFEDPRAPWFMRIISYEDRDEWRNRIAEILIKADRVEDLIEWGRAYVEKTIDRELREYNQYAKKSIIRNVNGIKIVVVVKKSSSAAGVSSLAHYLLSLYDAEIVAVLRSNGSISFRSKNYNVREIAKALGGGGHVKAAGARIRISFIDRILLSIGLEKPLLLKTLKILESLVKNPKD
ncbi:MAG: DHHA1 domain-containing protein [Sulfolobales archaeon]